MTIDRQDGCGGDIKCVDIAANCIRKSKCSKKKEK